MANKNDEGILPTYPYFKSNFTPTHGTICSYKKPHVLLWVYTAVKNFRHRAVVRKTWGLSNFYYPIRVLLLFSIAGTNSSKMQKLINREQRIYNDIVQDNGFIDAYRNLTYKVFTLLLLNWKIESCVSVTVASCAKFMYLGQKKKQKLFWVQLILNLNSCVKWVYYYYIICNTTLI